MTKSSDDKVEQVFALLKDARKNESDSKFWKATEQFSKAHHLLLSLASEATEEKIATLYASEAKNYWKKSRSTLIQAMEDEDQSEKDDESKPACRSLDDDEAHLRTKIFSALFSRPMEDPDEMAIETTDDLAARLKALNQSLPSEFKSTSERLSEVNKGLSKLGVSSVYTSSTRNRFVCDELPKSEDEQIDDIIAQAKDEATLLPRRNNEEPSHEINASESDWSSSDDDDARLEDSWKGIEHQVAKAQVKLAELSALLEQARNAQEDEETPICHSDSDEDSFREEIQQHDLAFLLLAGKRKLKGAQKNVQKALEEWKDLA